MKKTKDERIAELKEKNEILQDYTDALKRKLFINEKARLRFNDMIGLQKVEIKRLNKIIKEMKRNEPKH